jgi:hypothetical protein
MVQPGATKTHVLGGPSGVPTDGWARLASSAEFTATLFYRIPGVGNVGIPSSPETGAIKAFSYVESGTKTGFALANPSELMTSEVTFKIYDAAGQLQREATLELAPLNHRAFFFSEPPYLISDNGSVTVLASQPVVAVSLRLDGAMLAGVPVVIPGLPIRGEWNDESPNIIGGYNDNSVEEQVVGATIGGGGSSSDLDSGGPNSIAGVYGTVGGGRNNVAHHYATVGGGDGNAATEGHTTVAGGNANTASGPGSTVCGGASQVASGWASTIGGGYLNVASDNDSTVGGGARNTASGRRSTVSGGLSNTASGENSTVGGGSWNIAAGAHSFAAGHKAQALHDGSAVWADWQGDGLQFASTAPNQFLIRAGGGVGINTNNPKGALDVNGSIYLRGEALHADYVFGADYRLESIEEHARLMWEKKHLPAVESGTRDEQGRDVVEYGSRMRGMLEELEKAHVYIEQLNSENKSHRTEIENLRSRLAEIEALLGQRQGETE